jgi:hypothetical protein
MTDIRTLLGLRLSSSIITGYIKALASTEPVPEVKSYPDAVYLNYFALGLSLLFSPKSGYKPTSALSLHELNSESLVLESIDIYNAPPADSTSSSAQSRRAEPAFSTFVALPLELLLARDEKDRDRRVAESPAKLVIRAGSTGKDIVGVLREPDRKGGGAGPSMGSIGIWCEWSKDGIMVELGGEEARGPQAWERGRDAVWKVITVFSPKK